MPTANSEKLHHTLCDFTFSFILSFLPLPFEFSLALLIFLQVLFNHVLHMLEYFYGSSYYCHWTPFTDHTKCSEIKQKLTSFIIIPILGSEWLGSTMWLLLRVSHETVVIQWLWLKMSSWFPHTYLASGVNRCKWLMWEIQHFLQHPCFSLCPLCSTTNLA